MFIIITVRLVTTRAQGARATCAREAAAFGDRLSTLEGA
jgi:hypothetical protein